MHACVEGGRGRAREAAWHTCYCYGRHASPLHARRSPDFPAFFAVLLGFVGALDDVCVCGCGVVAGSDVQGVRVSEEGGARG